MYIILEPLLPVSTAWSVICIKISSLTRREGQNKTSSGGTSRGLSLAPNTGLGGSGLAIMIKHFSGPFWENTYSLENSPEGVKKIPSEPNQSWSCNTGRWCPASRQCPGLSSRLQCLLSLPGIIKNITLDCTDHQVLTSQSGQAYQL